MAGDGAIQKFSAQVSEGDEYPRFLQRTPLTELPLQLRSCKICQLLYRTDQGIATTVWAHMLDDLRNNIAACNGPCELFFKALEECFPPGENGMPWRVTLQMSGRRKPQILADFEKFSTVVQIYVSGTYSNLPWSFFSDINNVIQDPRAPPTFEKVHKWIQKCASNHSKCNVIQGVPSRLPTRVLDVSQVGDDLVVKIVESSTLVADYIALSHCWGPTPFTTLKHCNYENFKILIPFSSLTRTFQDAIHVTRSLGIRYLWIDSFCIIQDDLEDWQTEASKMASIYESAYLVIAATTAASGDDGFLSHRPIRQFLESPTAIELEPITLFAKRLPSHHQFIRRGTDGENSPLLNRAWALQERLLATRILHFADGEMIYECNTRRYCECGEIHLVAQAYGHSQTEDIKLRFFESQVPENIGQQREGYHYLSLWLQIASDYSRRKLTFPKDRFPALSGLSRRMQYLGLGDYLAGMWRLQLENTLLWEPLEARNLVRNLNPYDRFIAPSWSWASRNFPVNWSRDILETGKVYDLLSHVLEVDVTSTGPDKFGAVTAGKLVLRGPTVEGVLCLTRDISGATSKTGGCWLTTNSAMSSYNELFQSEINVFEPTGKDYSTADVLCIQMRRFRISDTNTSSMLVLRRTNVAVPRKDLLVYERVGIKSSVKSTWFAKAKIQTLVLV